MATPTTTSAWSVREIDPTSFNGLALKESVPLPKLGDYDVLVQIEAVSLNYRELAIPRGLYPFAMSLPVVPGSDSSGIAVAVGPKVTKISKGDRVYTLFNELHQAGEITPEGVGSGLGGAVDGTLRNYGVFPEHGLVQAPQSLSAIEASTLTCAPLTAWNALYGLQSKTVRAVAAGATVVATTSSNDKVDALKKLGASHVVNYREIPNWGEAARALTPKGLGFDHILEIGGAASIAQSLKGIKLGSVITIIGFLTSSDTQPALMEALNHLCIVRGIFVGSKVQFEEMNRAIDSIKLRPVVESKIFSFEEVKEAYQYQWDRKNFGKVVIQVGNKPEACTVRIYGWFPSLDICSSDSAGFGESITVSSLLKEIELVAVDHIKTTATVILDGRVPGRELLQRDAVLGKDVGTRDALLDKVKGIAVIYHIGFVVVVSRCLW
ncbi:alcohol dehydrogenase [Fusarium denticulatum]|uniref:Alcohol dehydrogenase n=1 Tax=Fusarium denticulatum TaxID=48507 RepID=A0A8H5XCT2_9HYPO|nr:alcohol dehydrogenase [Fusarium denticulatum]